MELCCVSLDVRCTLVSRKFWKARFADVAESEPELLARHCTEAGSIEKPSREWGKAGLRSLGRSALIEAKAQLPRALAQIASLPSTPALRQEQSRLQVGLAQALMHIEGYAARETKWSFEQARMFMDRAEMLGEPPEDSVGAILGSVRLLGRKLRGVQ